MLSQALRESLRTRIRPKIGIKEVMVPLMVKDSHRCVEFGNPGPVGEFRIGEARSLAPHATLPMEVGLGDRGAYICPRVPRSLLRRIESPSTVMAPRRIAEGGIDDTPAGHIPHKRVSLHLGRSVTLSEHPRLSCSSKLLKMFEVGSLHGERFEDICVERRIDESDGVGGVDVHNDNVVIGHVITIRRAWTPGLRAGR